MLTDKQLHDAQKRLKKRFMELRSIIHDELITTQKQNFIELAGKVHEVDEESFADLLVDLQLASIDRHVTELREVEAALRRIAERSYGLCADCRGYIDNKRLAAWPTARRCIDCQSRYEGTHISQAVASL